MLEGIESIKTGIKQADTQKLHGHGAPKAFIFPEPRCKRQT